MEAAFGGREIPRLELENIHVKICQSLRFAGTNCEMAKRDVLLPRRLGVDLSAVFVSGLRKVKVISAGSCAL